MPPEGFSAVKIPGAVRATGVGTQFQGGASGVCETRRGHRAVAGGYVCPCHSAEQHLVVFIEAKPKIRSLGELLRQINIYKAGSNFYV
jgi:hypothetical protein